MTPITIDLGYRIESGFLVDERHAVYVRDGQHLILARVDRVGDAHYSEDRSTAVITLSKLATSLNISEIVDHLRGRTAWDWLTQDALNLSGRQYDFYLA